MSVMWPVDLVLLTFLCVRLVYIIYIDVFIYCEPSLYVCYHVKMSYLCFKTGLYLGLFRRRRTLLGKQL